MSRQDCITRRGLRLLRADGQVGRQLVATALRRAQDQAFGATMANGAVRDHLRAEAAVDAREAAELRLLVAELVVVGRACRCHAAGQWRAASRRAVRVVALDHLEDQHRESAAAHNGIAAQWLRGLGGWIDAMLTGVGRRERCSQ